MEVALHVVFASERGSQAMMVSIHTLMGAALGRLCRTPSQAFLSGLLSHMVADMLPHKDLEVAEEAVLLAGALGLVTAIRGGHSREFAGALGAALPDLENLLGRALRIPDERMLVPTHRRWHGPRTRDFRGQLALALLSLVAVAWPSSSKD